MSSFADRLEQFGEAIALRLPDGTNISYLELAKIVDQYSATLNKLLPEHFFAGIAF